MNEMGWTWEDLMNTPYEEYLKISRIISLEKKEESKQEDKIEEEAGNANI